MGSAAARYPEFAHLYDWLREEVEGLTEEQLDWDDQSQEWSKWSIRRQLSHIAYAYFFQMVMAWGKHFFKDRQKPQPFDPAGAAKYDRRLDEEVFWDLKDILPQVQNSINIAREILSRLDESDLFSITMDRSIPADATFANGYERIGAYMARAVRRHPVGLERDPNDPTLWHMKAVYIFQHMVWETLVHLNTIQRLKRAQGLPTRVRIPQVGYLQDPWFSGEPAAT